MHIDRERIWNAGTSGVDTVGAGGDGVMDVGNGFRATLWDLDVFALTTWLLLLDKYHAYNLR
jgi:hypothetical protein